MRQGSIFLFSLLFALQIPGAGFETAASARAVQDEPQQRRVLTVPDDGRRRRRVRPDRPRGRGIKSAFARAGRGAGRGGKRFGQNMAKGRPVRAGKELGKGMGTFGKYTGKGVARTAKRVFKP